MDAGQFYKDEYHRTREKLEKAWDEIKKLKEEIKRVEEERDALEDAFVKVYAALKSAEEGDTE